MTAYHVVRHHTSLDTIIHPTSESPELQTVRREFMIIMTDHGVRNNSSSFLTQLRVRVPMIPTLASDTCRYTYGRG